MKISGGVSTSKKEGSPHSINSHKDHIILLNPFTCKLEQYQNYSLVLQYNNRLI